jgi:UDP-N-acetylglucosamine--N-acetylmuramyl-(pentapeptide) pyrophosphoryl-undecaprenol N-acetylglucosamine transferase
MTFVLAGGGTGGHVIPALAVARELRERGHEVVFIGTQQGIEAKLVPAEGFDIEWIDIGGLMRVGLVKTLRTLAQLPVSIARAREIVKRREAQAVFSMGGYVAGPVAVAAVLARIPLVLLEPDATPGFTNRHIGRWATRALVNFSEAARFFPKGRTEQTGLPVRAEFFDVPPKPVGTPLTILVTGGSRGSRRLNQATRASRQLFEENSFPVRWIHQCGRDDYQELAEEFSNRLLDGMVTPFIDDMPGAFADADLVICRSGAGAVAELAAAGKPAILVPFPYAAHQHQLRNAQAFAAAGAAKVVLDHEMTGENLFQETQLLASEAGLLEKMGQAARSLARPEAARQAASALEQAARRNSS